MAAVLKVSVLDGLRRTVGATLRIDPAHLDIDARLDSIGIDSIISMELMTAISKTLGVSMTPTQFLDVTTVRELAHYIEANFSVEAGAISDVTSGRAYDERSAPQEDEHTRRQSLLEFIRQRYSIDPGQQEFESLDELVEELVAQNEDSLLDHYELSNDPAANADIAIVGMSCRFPDAADPQQFWENLVENKNSIRAIPGSRWNSEECYAATPGPGRTISKWAALLDGVDLFDAGFFGIPAEDAALIDPQERLLFEEAYKAFQDAGVDTARLAGSRTGVFVGYEYLEYEQRLRTQPQVLQGRPLLSSSTTAYYLANRLSYVFDLRGPSESINVNCASSALSINRACQSLLAGESDLALAGGVSLNLFAEDFIALSQLGLLSADGTCGVFDNDANGYTRGEGVAAIVLKRVADARRDNDRIFAVIKACHQANRGRAKSLSTIRHEAITDAIRECHAKAAIPSDSVRYIELSGYSKRWGDSFEFEGIKNVFQSASMTKHCALGSLKGNVGHLEPASGIASVIKVAMSLWNQKFPPTITRRTPNEFIDLANAAHPLYFADAAIPFDGLRKEADTRVRAGVNSFCDSGVNIHILLEEYRDSARAAPDRSIPCPLFVLSARNRARLDDYIAEFARFLARPDSVPLADMLYTLQTRRDAMEERVAILAGSREELLEKLQRITRSRSGDLEARGIYFGNVQQSKASSFITSDVTREIVQRHLQTRQWQGLAQLWVNGAVVDWRAPWRHERAQPVSLPAYPFERQRHWLEFQQTSPVAPALQAALPAARTASIVAATAAPNGHAHERPAFHAPPRNDLETRLVNLWAEVLELPPSEVGIHDNFFELGGDSLLATQVVSRMRGQLGVNLPLIAFLEVSNIEGAAQVIASINFQRDDQQDDVPAEDDQSGVFEEGALTDQPEPITDLPTGAADMSAASVRSEDFAATHLAYWREKLAGVPSGLNLPTDYPRSSAQESAAAVHRFVLDSQLKAKLLKLSAERQCTWFMTAVAAFEALLFRYTGQEDLCIGWSIAPPLDGEAASGAANTLVLRSQLRGEDTFSVLVARVKTDCVEAWQNREVPFEQMVELLRGPRATESLIQAPLFQVMVRLRSASTLETDAGNCDLTLELAEQDAVLAGSIEYNKALYKPGTIERLANHFIALCHALIAQPDARIDALQFLSDAEQRQLLVEFNDTRAEYPSHQCIHELFADHVARTPERIAVAHENETLTYRQLFERSHELALYLQSLGVAPDQLIGLCVERTPDLVVGILGILQAGGAYVPLDPNYPDIRIEHMLRDSGAPLVLTQAKLAGRLAALSAAGTQVIALDAPWPKRDGELQREVRSQHLAYVIYTSGSTGTPKGVLVEHRGVVNLVTWHRNAFSFDSHTVTSCTAGLGFDACAWEVHSALCAGATLLLPPGSAAQDPAQLIHWWSTQPITSSFLVTALAEQVIARGVSNSRLTSLLMGGDQARAAIPRELPFDVVNNYGPTEITVVATSGVCEKGSQVGDIGRPIANTSIYILDRNGQPVPLGVAGEIYIGGAGVARGYLNRPELTQERFLADPFAAEPGARMYRSGDVGCWRPDGSIEFLGRHDSQVKIRGYRIELGEIEAQLAKHAAVKDAVVLAREPSPGQKRLVAYFSRAASPTHDANPDVAPLRAQLKAYLKQTLPEYMVPGAFVHIDAIPLTAHGKVDRRGLEQLPVSWESGESYVAPRNETETQVIGFWAQLLNLDPGKIGVHDNFFELGGNSLSATQLIAKLRDQLEIEIPLTAIFNANTVAHVADAVIAIKRQQRWALDEPEVRALELEEGCL